MHKFRKAIGILLAVCFAVFAQSAGAKPSKIYSLEFLLPATTPNGDVNPAYDIAPGGTGQLMPPTVVTVTLKNQAPPGTGNSNIGSFRFTVNGLTVLTSSCPNALCTVDESTNTVMVTNISAPVQAQQQYVLTLTVNSCAAINDAKIPQQSISVFNGSQFTGDMFNPHTSDNSFPMVLTLSTRSGGNPPTITSTGISCGDIQCGENFQVANTECDALNPERCVTTIRGLDKNGVCAANVVNYFVTNNLHINSPSSSNKHLHFKWETNDAGVFAYKVTVESILEPTWRVSWLPVSGPPAFIAAPNCNSVIGYDGVVVGPPTNLPLPAQYATLTQDVNSSKNKIQVALSAGVILPAVPFPIVVGNERMSVTNVSNNNWTVVRGDGMTGQDPHLATAAVMSTPLPKLNAGSSPYQSGMQAQMCLGSTSKNNGDGTWSVWVLDIGDGWITPNF